MSNNSKTRGSAFSSAAFFNDVIYEICDIFTKYLINAIYSVQGLPEKQKVTVPK
jgi:hypothetical protein